MQEFITIRNPFDGKVLEFPIAYQDINTGILESCPYCGRRHTHSIGSGHRVTHCTNKGDIKIKLLNGATISSHSGYYLIAR